MKTTRRNVLKSLAMTGVALPFAPSRAAAKPAASRRARSLQEMFAQATIIDDLGGYEPNPSLPDGGFSMIKESGVTIVSPTLGSVGLTEEFPDGAAGVSLGGLIQGYLEKLRAGGVASLSKVASDAARYPDRMIFVRRYSDLEAAKREGKLGVLANFQNTAAVGTDLKNLDLFFGLGLRQMQLTHNWRNWVGDGCTERTQAGLSYFGVEMVERMNELGIIVDAGHCGYQTSLDAIEVSKKPIVFSHTNCKALCDHPRNKTDEQIKALVARGGVMGISSFNWFVSDKPRSTLDDLLDHYDYAIRLVGPDHVGIGSDFDLPGWEGTEPDAQWNRHRRIYADREWKVLKGRFPPHIEEVNNAQRYWRIAEGLQKRGHSLDDIEKVLGGSFLRVFKEILPA
jgi:membrane dipeptidase